MDSSMMPAELRALIQESQRLARLIAQANARMAELRSQLGQTTADENLVDQIFEKCSTSSNPMKSEEECTVCMNTVEHPIGCTSCNKVVGCLSCCKKWVETAKGRGSKPSCPLCRNEWKSSEDVKEMTAEDKKK